MVKLKKKNRNKMSRQKRAGQESRGMARSIAHQLQKEGICQSQHCIRKRSLTKAVNKVRMEIIVEVLENLEVLVYY